jgi:N-acetyl-anhydromuramyl-L-alanine amidase AmpD
VLFGLLGSETYVNEPAGSPLAPPLMACTDPTLTAAQPASPALPAPAAAATPAQERADGVECPPGLNCQFTPAYYGLNDPANPADYGNYSFANRPADGIDIRYVVLHNTEEDYPTTIDIFQDPVKYVSVHYVIDTDGSITQMLPTHDIGWHGGNSYVYNHAIGIEHIGFAIEGNEWYTDEMYAASAQLVRYLADRYDIPLDRAHIIGHDEIPGRTPRHQAAMHWDPGPFWDWDRYMALMGAPLTDPAAPANSNLVALRADFATNRPPMTYCYPGGGCGAVPEQGANFAYVRAAPDFNAPLLTDPYLGGRPTDAPYWASKLMAGQLVYRAGRQGEWDAVYFGGQLGWLYNPGGSVTTPAQGLLVTPKTGRASIPAFGHPYPEAEAFPPGAQALPRYGYRYPTDFAYAPGDDMVPLYQIPAGQVYAAATAPVQARYVSIPYAPDRAAATSLIVNGQTEYYQVYYNHRFVFVRAADVDVLACGG